MWGYDRYVMLGEVIIGMLGKVMIGMLWEHGSLILEPPLITQYFHSVSRDCDWTYEAKHRSQAEVLAEGGRSGFRGLCWVLEDGSEVEESASGSFLGLQWLTERKALGFRESLTRRGTTLWRKASFGQKWNCVSIWNCVLQWRCASRLWRCCGNGSILDKTRVTEWSISKWSWTWLSSRHLSGAGSTSLMDGTRVHCKSIL